MVLSFHTEFIDDFSAIKESVYIITVSHVVDFLCEVCTINP